MTIDAFEERICAECGDAFSYTEPERHFRAEHGMNPPIRCPECRSVKRAQRNAELTLTAGSPAFGASERDSDRRRSPRNGRANNAGDRFPAICAACGASTLVPFVPRGDRPVYCRTCFNARRGR